ncbi:MAG: hypothetical protein ACYSOF_07160 [Planctomycetota bacterium]
MMPIRREDKEFIQALSLFGALLGACIGVFGVAHISTQSRQQHTEQSEYQQAQEALLKLSSTVVNPGNPIADENVLTQVQQQIEQTPVPKEVAEESFWTGIPRWGYLGLCGGGGVVGAMGGYCGVWVIGWCGSIFTYSIIRSLYRALYRVAPGCVAKSRIQPPLEQDNPATAHTQREDGRMLPAIVKLFFLLAFVLGILAAVVWHITAV